VLFEGPADEALARRAIEILEAAYWRIAAELSTYPDRVVRWCSTPSSSSAT
jgi:hypothetical protein